MECYTGVLMCACGSMMNRRIDKMDRWTDRQADKENEGDKMSGREGKTALGALDFGLGARGLGWVGDGGLIDCWTLDCEVSKL
mmetsp:Transcript_24000/g.60787  ORF Transcript_24000/g.60787 Transcript_24000/m.60787 type:complete len:83 (+) Transcript_24000:117-365(+)